MKKVILIHGNGGATVNDIWFPKVKKELEELGLLVIAKTFPDNKLARASYWLPFIKELGADEETILIGHSSGAEAAMRYAEENKLFGSVLIGASYTDLGQESERASGYFDSSWQWEKIRGNQNFIIQFSSTDDPYIPFAEAEYVHKRLQTELHTFTDRGHFMQNDFPELKEVLKKHLA